MDYFQDFCEGVSFYFIKGEKYIVIEDELYKENQELWEKVTPSGIISVKRAYQTDKKKTEELYSKKGQIQSQI